MYVPDQDRVNSFMIRVFISFLQIPIGLMIGCGIFSLIPIAYGFFGVMLTAPVLLAFPRLRWWVVLPVYWLAVILLFALSPESWRVWLFEPFRDMSRYRH